MKKLFSIFTTTVLSLVLFSACHDDPPAENHDVAVDAGINQAIQLPANSVTLHGTVLSGSTTTMTYAWTQLSGPANGIIVNSSSTETPVNDLVAGTYIFQFAATNSYGNTGIDTVSVTVTSAQLHTVVAQPDHNPTETLMVQTATNFSDPTNIEFIAEAWTSGSYYNIRSMVQFDLSGIPAGATIVSAKLSLYTNHPPMNGNLVDANFGTANQLYVGRITAPWTNSTLWQNQPATDAASQILVPLSTSSFQDLENLDVTSLVGSMVSGDNYGFKIYLQNEVPYNSRIYCSSKHADASKHPKLEVIYY